MTDTTDASNPPPYKPFTGYRRGATRRSVKWADAVAHHVISIGGIGVTLAFATIVLFLFYVGIPLFQSPQVDPGVVVQLPAPADPSRSATRAIAMEPDENLVAAWMIDDAGLLSTYRLQSGERVGSEKLTDRKVTAFSNSRGIVALGLEDGAARVGRIQYQVQWLDALPDVMEALLPGQTVAHDGGVAELTPIGQTRVVRAIADLTDPIAVGEGEPSPVRLIDYIYDDNLEALVAMREDGRLFFDLIRKRRNMMTGKYTTRVEKYELPRSGRASADLRPIAVLMGQNGRQVYLIYEDGHLVRYNTDDPANAHVVEETDVLPEANRRVTGVRMLAGDVTLIIADDQGGVSGWFAAPYPEGVAPATKDWLHMVRAHRLPDQPGEVTSIATSGRDRQFITGDADGTIVLRHMTSGTNQATVRIERQHAVRLLSIAPKNDAIVALDEMRALSLFSLDNPHADSSMKELFLPVHYEGYAEPRHIWQSSAGTDDAEPKHGLIPLIFGTLKATFYAMIFAVPIALLAAIYSSEFMQPRVRAVVKPAVEMMAGLPSVVLGFIAALVLAPFLEDVLTTLFVVFAAIPLGVMLFGFIWQTLPPHLVRAAPPWVPFTTMLLVVIGAMGLSWAIGPVIEEILFFGDIRGWLGGRVGRGALGAAPGWMMLLTPAIAVGLVLTFNAYIRPRVPLFQGARGRAALAAADLARFVVTGILAVGIAFVIGAAFSAIGWDLRGSLIGEYVQRNTLIVGMIMGFAIIPIIYTVSEDALTSVPNTLRSASLGAGATPWQTAVRVVLPVAVSGIFSACMIGFGRAAGETMIVLMAAGNTPVIDLNIFTGARTLSANIAVELPEAPVGSTHYRILFLSALVLFALTFAVNTAAEIVRMRFRRRAYQL